MQEQQLRGQRCTKWELEEETLRAVGRKQIKGSEDPENKADRFGLHPVGVQDETT